MPNVLSKEYLDRLKRQGFKAGHKPWNFNKTQFNDETIKQVADSKRGKHHAPQSEFKTGHKPYYIPSAEKHWNWQGGISSIRHRLTQSSKWKRWRDIIFNRDNFTCRYCGKVGGKLHPHHIYPFEFGEILKYLKEINGIKNLYEVAINFELLWNPLIGRTCCVDCHRETDSYGNKKRK